MSDKQATMQYLNSLAFQGFIRFIGMKDEELPFAPQNQPLINLIDAK